MKTSFIKQTKIENSIDHEMVMTTPVMNGRTLPLAYGNDNPFMSPAFNLTPIMQASLMKKNEDMNKALNSIKGLIGVKPKNANTNSSEENNLIKNQNNFKIPEINSVAKTLDKSEKKIGKTERTPKKDSFFRSPKKELVDSTGKISYCDADFELEMKDKANSLTNCCSYSDFVRSKTLDVSSMGSGDSYHKKIVKPKANSNSCSSNNLQKLEIEQINLLKKSSKSKFEPKIIVEEKKSNEKKEDGKVLNIKSKLKQLE